MWEKNCKKKHFVWTIISTDIWCSQKTMCKIVCTSIKGFCSEQKMQYIMFHVVGLDMCCFSLFLNMACCSVCPYHCNLCDQKTLYLYIKKIYVPVFIVQWVGGRYVYKKNWWNGHSVSKVSLMKYCIYVPWLDVRQKLQEPTSKDIMLSCMWF